MGSGLVPAQQHTLAPLKRGRAITRIAPTLCRFLIVKRFDGIYRIKKAIKNLKLTTVVKSRVI